MPPNSGGCGAGWCPKLSDRFEYRAIYGLENKLQQSPTLLEEPIQEISHNTGEETQMAMKMKQAEAIAAGYPIATLAEVEEWIRVTFYPGWNPDYPGSAGFTEADLIAAAPKASARIHNYWNTVPDNYEGERGAAMPLRRGEPGEIVLN
jgi:hypothetical protein